MSLRLSSSQHGGVSYTKTNMQFPSLAHIQDLGDVLLSDAAATHEEFLNCHLYQPFCGWRRE